MQEIIASYQPTQRVLLVIQIETLLGYNQELFLLGDLSSYDRLFLLQAVVGIADAFLGHMDMASEAIHQYCKIYAPDVSSRPGIMRDLVARVRDAAIRLVELLPDRTSSLQYAKYSNNKLYVLATLPAHVVGALDE